MVKRAVLALGLLGLALLPTASAQSQANFNSEFAVAEIAMPPRAAARQQMLFANAMSALPPQRPGQLDTYLLVAAFWSDPVFENEARQGAEILSRRLGAQGRTIVLTEGVGGGERAFAAATPANINAALGRIGELIDRDEDLVVLFLTSHGSPDGSIAIRDHGRMTGQMRPVHLRNALNDAEIRNRVVIVSACFSGAFIPPLMDDNTIVLTAAAYNRTSFGCQPSRDWTYFGDAFLSRAVGGGSGLVSGFDQAARTISQWETEQRLTPSLPQKSVGPRAAEMLSRAERNGR